MSSRTIVTISRQLGCGGAEVGQIVASRLGLRYADRDILRMAAEALQVRDEDIAWRDEKPATIWEHIAGLFPYGLPDAPYTPPPVLSVGDDELYEAEARIIRQLAEREDCVIVGRGGAQVLRTHPCATHVLLHAPVERRIERLMRVYGPITRQEAESMIRKCDADRRAYHTRVLHDEWLTATNYHLCLDTSALQPDGIADLIVHFVDMRRRDRPTP